MINVTIRNLALAVETNGPFRLTVFGYDGRYGYQIVHRGTGAVENSQTLYRCEANAKRFGRARMAKMARPK